MKQTLTTYRDAWFTKLFYALNLRKEKQIILSVSVDTCLNALRELSEVSLENGQSALYIFDVDLNKRPYQFLFLHTSKGRDVQTGYIIGHIISKDNLTTVVDFISYPGYTFFGLLPFVFLIFFASAAFLFLFLLNNFSICGVAVCFLGLSVCFFYVNIFLNLSNKVTKLFINCFTDHNMIKDVK